MKVENVPIASLQLDDRNARVHSEKNLKAIAGSLSTFGQRRPIVVWNNVVIAGNGTLQAAQSIGWSEIDIVRVPADWDIDKARAYALADNRTAELADWDAEILANHLIELDAVGYEIGDWGFEPLNPPTTISDEDLDNTIIETPSDPISKLGDIYKIGRHTVICGDATDASVFERLLQGTDINMVWTDPPYGVAVVGGPRALSSTERKQQGGLEIQNDAMSVGDLKDFLTSALSVALIATRPGACWYVASPGVTPMRAFADVLDDLGIYRHTLIWAKDSFVLGRADYHYQHEIIFYGWTPGAAHTWNGGRKQDSILKIDRPKQNKDHPTMKPVELIRRCIENSSNPDENILDPFAGSGSTLLAAEATGRIGYGIELDPRYVDVIVRRLEQATGSEASKL